MPLWPVLVADLADDAARDFLSGVALAGGRVFVPLLAPPANNRPHKLEVYTPGHTEPLVFRADPLGAAAATGFPLRLAPWDANAPPPAPPAETPKKDTSKKEAPLRPKRPAEHQISERHERDLTEKRSEPSALVGRALAAGKLQI